jgi:large subunit ribosomal protein L29
MAENTKRADRITEIREMAPEALGAALAEAREEAFRLRFRSATEAIDNPMRFRALRRDIARLETEVRARLKTED